MAKGDRVTVLISTGSGVSSESIVASKAGRVVKTTTRTRAKVQWIDVEEMTRTGRATGLKMSVRLDSVVAISEVRSDDELPPVKRPKRKPDLSDAASLVQTEAMFDV